MLHILPKEIISIIFEYCNTHTQINTISTNKYAYNNYVIKNLLDRKHNYLSNSVIEQHKFRLLEKLKIKRSDNITQSCIDTLNIIELYMIKNYNIYNVCHMKNLKILSVNYDPNISNDSMDGLNNLTELYIDNIQTINDIKKIHKFTNIECKIFIDNR